MVCFHSLFCQKLVSASRLSVVAERYDADTAARREVAPYLYIARLHQGDEILHDDIDTVLMKSTVIAETEQVEFEALALYHLNVRNIVDVDSGKVRLPCDRA